jgi:hypothetical protein
MRDDRVDAGLNATLDITSIPVCRKTLRAGKINRYIDFKYLKICVYINISYIF